MEKELINQWKALYTSLTTQRELKIPKQAIFIPSILFDILTCAHQ